MESQNHESLKLEIDNYSGPLDVLLDLAKSQKVNLTNISITQLADQFAEFINSVSNWAGINLIGYFKYNYNGIRSATTINKNTF